MYHHTIHVDQSALGTSSAIFRLLQQLNHPCIFSLANVSLSFPLSIHTFPTPSGLCTRAKYKVGGRLMTLQPYLQWCTIIGHLRFPSRISQTLLAILCRLVRDRLVSSFIHRTLTTHSFGRVHLLYASRRYPLQSPYAMSSRVRPSTVITRLYFILHFYCTDFLHRLHIQPTSIVTTCIYLPAHCHRLLFTSIWLVSSMLQHPSHLHSVDSPPHPPLFAENDGTSVHPRPLSIHHRCASQYIDRGQLIYNQRITAKRNLAAPGAEVRYGAFNCEAHGGLSSRTSHAERNGWSSSPSVVIYYAPLQAGKVTGGAGGFIAGALPHPGTSVLV